MARTEAFISAPPEAVFEVLADPIGYGEWVVGSREIGRADASWPDPGASFSFTAGFPPLTMSDETIVERAEPPFRLVLRVGGGLLPDARVTFDLEPVEGGTRVTLIEDVANPVLNFLAGPLGHLAVRLRNRETLRRLKARVEG
jgi:uncharacterized protein YndB with AHSA1/START domain